MDRALKSIFSGFRSRGFSGFLYAITTPFKKSPAEDVRWDSVRIMSFNLKKVGVLVCSKKLFTSSMACCGELCALRGARTFSHFSFFALFRVLAVLLQGVLVVVVGVSVVENSSSTGAISLAISFF